MPKKEREDWETEKMRELFKVIAQLQTPLEAKLFLRDLCALPELKALAERWAVSKEVYRKFPYRKIHKMTGASIVTITRVAHWIHHGTGGWERMLKKTAKTPRK